MCSITKNNKIKITKKQWEISIVLIIKQEKIIWDGRDIFKDNL